MADPSEIIALADAVANDLNGREWSQTFTAERTYEPRYVVEEGAGLVVQVVAKSDAEILATRTDKEHGIQIDVGIVKKLRTADRKAEMDGLMGLCEEVCDAFGPLTRYGSFRWLSHERTTLWSQDHLKQHGVFLSLVTLTFKKIG